MDDGIHPVLFWISYPWQERVHRQTTLAGWSRSWVRGKVRSCSGWWCAISQAEGVRRGKRGFADGRARMKLNGQTFLEHTPVAGGFLSPANGTVELFSWRPGTESRPNPTPPVDAGALVTSSPSSTAVSRQMTPARQKLLAKLGSRAVKHTSSRDRGISCGTCG